MMSYWRYETLHLLTITFYMGLDTISVQNPAKLHLIRK